MKKDISNITMSNKKLKRFIFLSLFIITIYLILYFLPRNYEINYKINDYEVTEKYDKKQKLYTFKFQRKNKMFEITSNNKYTSKRALIEKIKEYKKEDTQCIVINSEIIKNNILCLKNNEKIDYHLVGNVLPKKYYKTVKNNNKNYKDISANLIDDKTYFVWNYKDLIKINQKKDDKIKIFKNDIYNIKLVTMMDKYLIIANYDQKYNFNKFIKLNMETGKTEEIKFSQDISFDSRIIGNYKNNFYLIDEKNKKEYEVNIKKNKVSVVSRNGMGKILKNDEWEKVKINKIITDNIIFEEDSNYTYKIENDNLYLYELGLKNGTKLTDKKIKEIVYSSDEEVYYIVDDKLYKYSFEYGEVEVLSYFELNFNYKNMIFIY